MFERTTRECAMSPMIATFTPSRRPRRSRIVKASRSACVGCSCAPSPALMIDAGSRSASIFGAPGYLWRMTIMSGAIAIRFWAVSMRVSPFSTDDPEAEKLSVSAERRFSAISNDTRVRVDASMKRLMTSWPRSAGTFLTGRSLTSLKPSAVSRTSVISSGESCSMPRRSLDLSDEVFARICGLNLLLHDQHFILTIELRHPDFDHFIGIGGNGFADHVGVNGKLAMAAIDQHCQHDGTRTSEIDQRVESGANSAAGIENIVDQNHDFVVDRLGKLRRLDDRLRRDGR